MNILVGDLPHLGVVRNFFLFGTFPTGKPLVAKDVRSDGGGNGPHVHIGQENGTAQKLHTVWRWNDGQDGPVYLGATVQWAFLAM